MRRICQIQFIHLFTCRINVECMQCMCIFMIGHTTRYAIFNFYHSPPKRITMKTKQKLFEFNFIRKSQTLNRMLCLFKNFVIAYQFNCCRFSFYFIFSPIRFDLVWLSLSECWMAQISFSIDFCLLQKKKTLFYHFSSFGFPPVPSVDYIAMSMCGYE